MDEFVKVTYGNKSVIAKVVSTDVQKWVNTDSGFNKVTPSNILLLIFFNYFYKKINLANFILNFFLYDLFLFTKFIF